MYLTSLLYYNVYYLIDAYLNQLTSVAKHSKYKVFTECRFSKSLEEAKHKLIIDPIDLKQEIQNFDNDSRDLKIECKMKEEISDECKLDIDKTEINEEYVKKEIQHDESENENDADN